MSEGHAVLYGSVFAAMCLYPPLMGIAAVAFGVYYVFGYLFGGNNG